MKYKKDNSPNLSANCLLYSDGDWLLFPFLSFLQDSPYGCKFFDLNVVSMCIEYSYFIRFPISYW